MEEFEKHTFNDWLKLIREGRKSDIVEQDYGIPARTTPTKGEEGQIVILKEPKIFWAPRSITFEVLKDWGFFN